jgi:hypothetical protein
MALPAICLEGIGNPFKREPFYSLSPGLGKHEAMLFW